MDPHPGPSHFHLRSLYGNSPTDRRQPSERTKIHRSSHPRRQSCVFPERFQVRPRRRFPILLRRAARRFLPPPGRILHPLFAPVARRALSRKIPSSATNGRCAASSAPRPTSGHSTPTPPPAATAPPSARASTTPATSSCASTAASPFSRNPSRHPLLN